MKEIRDLSHQLRLTLGVTGGIRTVGRLLQQKPEELLRIKGMGPTKLRTVQQALTKWGLRLDMSREEIVALPDEITAMKLCDPSELPFWAR